ncbi:MAG: ECF transporter S component [bacterium]|nr:ECF transporter S component [bacterium]
MSTAKSTPRAPRFRVRQLTFSAVFLALALVLPFLTGQIPEIGSKLCPMHIPALLCGFVCGWPWGLAVGFLSPLLRSLILGMPPLFPTAAAMAFELATYGAVAGLLYRLLPRFRGRLYAVLLAAMLSGRVVWGVVRLVLAGLASSAFTWQAFITGAVVSAIPGIILQLVIIPPIVAVLDKAGLTLNK